MCSAWLERILISFHVHSKGVKLLDSEKSLSDNGFRHNDSLVVYNARQVLPFCSGNIHVSMTTCMSDR